MTLIQYFFKPVPKKTSLKLLHSHPIVKKKHPKWSYTESMHSQRCSIKNKLQYRVKSIKWATCHSKSSRVFVFPFSGTLWCEVKFLLSGSHLWPPKAYRPSEQKWMNPVWWLVFSLLQYLSWEPDSLYSDGRLQGGRVVHRIHKHKWERMWHWHWEKGNFKSVNLTWLDTWWHF